VQFPELRRNKTANLDHKKFGHFILEEINRKTEKQHYKSRKIKFMAATNETNCLVG